MFCTLRVPARRAVVLAPVLAAAALLPTSSAQASCSPNVVGVTSSLGAAPAQDTVCAPAWGRPSGGETGRKVG